MDLTEILQKPATRLPILQSENEPFRVGLKRVLETYSKLIASSDYKGTPLIAQLQKLTMGIIRTVDEYYEGKPSDAYYCLSECLRESMVADYLEKKGEIDRSTNLYRIRTKNSNYPLKKCDLFHIPFNQRGLVKTQRYSIPGLPSLYLANSIYVAWEEMMRPDINEIQAMRLTNNRPLCVLDMTTDGFLPAGLGDVYDQWETTQKLLTWPLVAACSVKVRQTGETFKPEYIIPQLLLQWINKSTLDGIKYSSTHINTADRQHQAKLYNLVIPVKSFAKEDGYCDALLNLFESTEVLPMQLRAFATTTNRFYGQGSPGTSVNADVVTLELVKGKEEMYWGTSFGVLEHALKGLSVAPILS
ncbi:RES domain-containing protein [Mucilaginibacter sp. E4BP6]|uniref:RES domain-containing protein n=1 Tax=Mucilaginibacter sp. E4BP6 TaxID=2723089 RepID=UPI0015C9A7DA|nr:RES domain-containing protein [Mucilaginibacter sp. E4BP6]NYE66902.1 hypothetical protein [Mucilaginibacter sp. E4BP6]